MPDIDTVQNIEASIAAKNLDDIWEIFDPMAAVDMDSTFYIPRNEDQLEKLTFNLKRNKRHFYSFLCGHVGSGKTTELRRLQADEKINQLYFPLYISVQELNIESVSLSHDALLVEIGRQLIAKTNEEELNPNFTKELNNWGKSIVETYIKDESVKAEVGAKASAWFAYFKAQLNSRNTWKHEEKLLLEPKVQDLIGILNRMAIDLKNKTDKRLLVMIDDLEKGVSDAEKDMHNRLFLEHYSVLTQPLFSIIYTLPVYFKALPSSRIDKDLIYSFSSVRLYEPKDKKQIQPPLDHSSSGYQLMGKFINQRIDDSYLPFEAGVQDELMRIGGGLFRDTARVIREAAYYGMMREAETISQADVKKVFNKLKKEYQPIVRGDAIAILKEVANCERGWVDGVEPFLQSRAIVEYENGDLWLDIRYVLKEYLENLTMPETAKSTEQSS